MLFTLRNFTGVQCTNGAGIGSYTTPPIDCTLADLLLIGLGHYTGPGSAGSTVADSQSNVWDVLATAFSGNLSATWLCARYPLLLDALQFFQVNCNTSFASIVALAYSGSLGAAGVADQNNNAKVDLPGATSLQAGSVTPGVANELVLEGIVLATAGMLANLSINNSFGTIRGLDHIATAEGFAWAPKVSSGAEAPAYDWTVSGNQEAAISTITLKPASAGGSRGLFQPSPLNGIGSGGPGFFRDPIATQFGG